MTKIMLLLFCILLSTVKCQTSPDSTKHSKTTRQIFKDCDSISPRHPHMLNSDLPDSNTDISDKKFTAYLRENYSEYFPRTSVEFELIFKIDKTFCCRQVLYDPSLLTPEKILRIKTILLDYNEFKTISKTFDETKALTIVISWDKGGKLVGFLMPYHIDK
jgi:hypothetical protein